MMVRVLLFLSISLLGFAATGGSLERPDAEAAGMSPARLANIHQRMQEFVDQGKAAGIVTVLARHGHLASLDAVGYQDLESKTPMRTDTLFRIMSLTKPVTCIGIMTLVDEGKVALDESIATYLPEFKGAKKAITVRQLLELRRGLLDRLRHERPVVIRFDRRAVFLNLRLEIRQTAGLPKRIEGAVHRDAVRPGAEL